MKCPQCTELGQESIPIQNEEYKGIPIWTCELGHRFGWVKADDQKINMEVA